MSPSDNTGAVPTLIHAEPSDRSIWFVAGVILVLVALGGGSFAGSAASLLLLLGGAACAAIAAKRAAHQVLLDKPARTVILREVTLAGHDDRRIAGGDIASFDCVPAEQSRAERLGRGGAYRLRMTLVSGESIVLTRPYAVPDIGGTPWRDIAPFQAALALAHALDVPVHGLDPWKIKHLGHASGV